MHSMEGALSESLYIYLPCTEKAMAAPSPHILSMGLGLAYNEIIAAALFQKENTKTFKMASFESVADLRTNCIAWVNNEPCELSPLYNTILDKVASHFDLAGADLKSFLLQAFTDGQWVICDSLPTDNPWPGKFHGILYDAFSSDTNSELWTEAHLQHFIKSYCSPEVCYFSTYAATGNLKRSLLQEGFVLEKRKGFGNKRESTFAIRS